MLEDALDDLGADIMPLVGCVDNDIPDRCAIDVISENSAETHQSILIPCRNYDIGMGQHLVSIFDVARIRPWCLAIQGDQLCCVDVLAVREEEIGRQGRDGRRALHAGPPWRWKRELSHQLCCCSVRPQLFRQQWSVYGCSLVPARTFGHRAVTRGKVPVRRLPFPSADSSFEPKSRKRSLSGRSPRRLGLE